MYEVVDASWYDQIRGIKNGMNCYVRGVRYVEQLDGSIVYEVDVLDWSNYLADGSGYYLLNEKQIRRIN